MSGQSNDPTFGFQDVRRDIAPITCLSDICIDNVVHRHRHRRDRAPGIDEGSTAFVRHRPLPVGAQRDILPANLAHAMRRRTRAGRF